MKLDARRPKGSPSRPQPPPDVWHRFLRDREIWSVARRATKEPKQTGLYFRRKGEERFLPFTRGALPSDNELASLCPEVLCTLLQRAGR